MDAEGPTPPQRAEALTFTTLAPQPGARYAAPEAIQQLALVRYQLEWDGGSAELPNTIEPPAVPPPEWTLLPSGRVQRPTYRLVKRARFPRTDNARLDMEEFDPAKLPLEVDPADLNRGTYAVPEPIGFNVLSMRIRLYCRPDIDPTLGEVIKYFVETGAVTSPAADDDLPDSSKTWTPGQHNGRTVRIISGKSATESGQINTTDPSRLVRNGTWTTKPDTSSQYWIEATQAPDSPGAPKWLEIDGEAYFGLIDRPPAMAEITLELTDDRATKVFTFTERFYIPASERRWTQQ